MKYKQGVADMFISNEICELIPIIAIPFYFFRVPTPNPKKRNHFITPFCLNQACG
jgi:hypothetical protein